MGISRKNVWRAAAALALAAVVPLWLYLRSPRIEDRIYRIGWQVDPPFQSMGPDGQASGLANDLVREAARRRGIRLQWVMAAGSEAALRAETVDLWPFITVTPERLKYFHITDPYVETELALLTRADGLRDGVQALTKSAIAVYDIPLRRSYLQSLLPESRIMPVPSAAEAIQDVCRHKADAAFMESYTVVSVLLFGGACADVPLRWIAVPGPRSRLGIGSVFKASAVADAIREEIGVIAAEGKLGETMGRWGYISGQQLESMEALLNAKRTETRLLAGIFLVALLLLLTLWQAIRLRRERNRAWRAEQAQRGSEAQFRGLLEAVQLSGTMCDAQGIMTFCNDFFLQVSGWRREEVIGHSLYDFFIPEHRESVRQRIESLPDGKTLHWSGEPGILTKDGKVRWFQVNNVVLRDAKGCVMGVASLAADVTDHRALQEQYLQAQKLEGLGRLAGGVAHDFNNLLTVINGYSELISRKLKDRDPIRSSIDQVRKAGARAADLTQQLLAFSRKQLIQPKPLDLNFIIADTEKMLRRLLGEDIELITRMDPDLGQVMADAGQIHQILMNLAANARDAMPDGGRLLLETANAGPGERPPEAAGVPRVRLSVSDSGIGFSEETKKLVFEPFFTTKPVGAGTGLGLATVYGIVKQSQGWIEVHSEPGKGARFDIWLPRIDSAPALAPAPAPEVAVNRCSGTLLLVEDQDEVRNFTLAVLEEAGYSVIAAADGPQALAHAAAHSGPIDLMMTDVIMPGMNGRELAERMGSIRPGIRILYTSGYSSEVIATRGVLEREMFYLPKPYDADTVIAKICEVLSPGVLSVS